VTQIHEKKLDLPMEEQDQHPIEFLSGEFKGAQQTMDSTREKIFCLFLHSNQGGLPFSKS
jgi:hypothetical protein